MKHYNALQKAEHAAKIAEAEHKRLYVAACLAEKAAREAQVKADEADAAVIRAQFARPSLVQFGTLNGGDLFECRGEIWIKVRVDLYEDRIGRNSFHVLGVRLHNGKGSTDCGDGGFSDGALVRPIKERRTGDRRCMLCPTDHTRRVETRRKG